MGWHSDNQKEGTIVLHEDRTSTDRPARASAKAEARAGGKIMARQIGAIFEKCRAKKSGQAQ
jgi:hypothetical protein